MRYYDNTNNYSNRKHHVEMTLQTQEYKGRIIFPPITGNCLGLDILGSVDVYDIIEYHDKCRFIGCDIELLKDDEGNDWFKYILEDEHGNTIEGEDEFDYFSRLIVGIRIVKCEEIE